MKFNRTHTYNIDNAIRGMRNPLESWDKSDTYIDANVTHIGEKDMALAQKLIKAGAEHSKFMRQIFVTVDITAPLYWWKEFDTYKVGTTSNSTSTMHTLLKKPITLECFEIDDYEPDIVYKSDTDWGEQYKADWYVRDLSYATINDLEGMRLTCLETNDKKLWKELIRWLPESWLQTRTITMSYANIRNMYQQRKNHKLTEWNKSFVGWVDTLPYAKELIEIE